MTAAAESEVVSKAEDAQVPDDDDNFCEGSEEEEKEVDPEMEAEDLE